MPAPANTAAVRKLHGFAVLGPAVNAVAIQKIHGYAVLHDPAIAPVPADNNHRLRHIPLIIGTGL